MRLLLAVTLFAAPALAQEGSSFDCSKAESSAEEAICATPDLAALDRRIAEVFARALTVVDALDTGAEEARTALQTEQRGWIGGRDDCWKAEDLKACIETAYLTREGQLTARWLLSDPTGTTFWRCDGNLEVVTSYFDTPLPSVRFEVGDTVDTGSLTRTASGSRYDGSFGRFIWIKGNEATYRSPDPDGQETRCVASD
ncbi:MliC family protein [Maritimibacter sp. DP1N21-5]|uniref:MliC family protein n=1 Tax=Maritimibacter sp. DP1N21-5 TaxID=2836867 RepID=UPI001C46D71C|nr:MliC family protein [Maritimibacter sp. DP1N21-5]MBV7408254.1 MliC family protein [Maritimibacter sp. DP1N21-5]